MTMIVANPEMKRYLLSDQYRAYEKAKGMWGRHAFANDSLNPGTFYVGVVVPEPVGTPSTQWDIKGKGGSWEEAFEDANRGGSRAK